jgi:arabinose-5-phosphate isomerase
MTLQPITVHEDTLAAEALEIMNSKEITALIVTHHHVPVGITHLHDLLRLGVA